MQEKIEHLISEGYTLSTLKTSARAWAITKKAWLFYIGFWIVFSVAYVILGMIPILGLLLSYLLLFPAVMAGFSIFSERLLQEEKPDFGFFFDGFKFLNQLIPYTLIYWLVSFVINIPMLFIFNQKGILELYLNMISGDQQAIQESITNFSLISLNGEDYLLITLTFVLSIFITLLFWWAPYLIVFHKMGFQAAIRNSVKLVQRQFGKHVELLLFALGISFLLLLAFTLLMALPIAVESFPLTFLSLFLFFFSCLLWISWILNLPLVAFEQVIGTREVEDDEYIAEHLLD